MKRTNPEEVQKDAANPTQFGPPLIAPGVSDPHALAYAQQIAMRRGPPKFAPPVAGGPAPTIPRLDAPSQEGLTMAEQGTLQRAAENPPAPATFPTAPSMFREGPAPMQQQVQQRPAAPFVPGISRPPGLLPTDILPPEARQDPAFREGHGAMYAQSQPDLAYKYGVLRGGQKVPPQQLAAAQPGLRSQTVEALEAIQKANAAAAPHALLDNDEKRAEREAAEGTAGAASRLAGGPNTGPKMTQEEAVEAARKMDDFDFNAFRERMTKDILNNEEQRTIIEKRCKDLSLEELITKGFVTQRVPIVPGKFEPTFRSTSAEDDLAIKRIIMEENRGLEVSDRYLLDKFSIMSVVLGVVAINSNPLPSYQNDTGNFDDKKFWVKFNMLTKYPLHMLGSLGVNFYWFDARVRKLFVAENLGNG